MHIFDKAQSARPTNSNGMSQYVNESFGPVQVNNQGDYINPQEAIVTFENSHILRALRNGTLREVPFDNKPAAQEPKTPKKSKKVEDIIPEEEPETATQAAVSNDYEIAEDTLEDSPVVATEPIEL